MITISYLTFNKRVRPNLTLKRPRVVKPQTVTVRIECHIPNSYFTGPEVFSAPVLNVPAPEQVNPPAVLLTHVPA